jgi:hypothetical protein
MGKKLQNRPGDITVRTAGADSTTRNVQVPTGRVCTDYNGRITVRELPNRLVKTAEGRQPYLYAEGPIEGKKLIQSPRDSYKLLKSSEFSLEGSSESKHPG